MSYKIEVTAFFEKQLKRLVKKYPSIKKDFTALVTTLYENPKQGTSIGNNCYKIRIAIESKGKGKRGGARIITHIHVIRNTIYLLSIYDKAEQGTIADKDLEYWLQDLNK
ncbi:MAG: addiction module toxin RelE [Bacteroidales bacterium]|nr:addiction module toxin RelE [Bacteroidales bacterium]